MSLRTDPFKLTNLRTYELMNLSKEAYQFTHKNVNVAIPSVILAAFQYLTEGIDPGPDSIKIGRGQFQINKSNRNALFLEAIHELGPVIGIRLAKFYIPEQHPVSPGIFYPLQQM